MSIFILVVRKRDIIDDNIKIETKILIKLLKYFLFKKRIIRIQKVKIKTEQYTNDKSNCNQFLKIAAVTLVTPA